MTYFQSGGGKLDGVVIFNGQIIRTTGRLDEIGSRVLASGFRYNGRRLVGVSVIVQCEKISNHEINIELTFLKPDGLVLASGIIEGVAISDEKTSIPRPAPPIMDDFPSRE